MKRKLKKQIKLKKKLESVNKVVYDIYIQMDDIKNNIDFNGRADEEIITYVSSNSTYSRYIDSVKGYQSLWRHAARRRDRNSRNYHLACTASALKTFEKFIRDSYNNSPTHKGRIYRNWG